MKIRQRIPHNKGISLILTLAMVVIATILVTGFLVATRLDSTATTASAASLQAEEIASGAMEMLVDNLRQEIAAGSTSTGAIPLSAAKTVFLPSTNLTMVPRRLGFATNDSLANLVRISSSLDVPTNYPANIYNQALLRDRLAASPSTNALTTSPLSSKDGRYIGTNRWLKPQLLPADATFPPPSWVFVTRAGTKPSASDGDVGGSGGMADPTIPNQNTCIGRVAFAIYDAGGLLNVNLAGFPDSVTDARVSGGKNSAYWADLTQLGLTSTQVNDFVGWRNAASGATAASFSNHVYTTGATNGFTKVRPGDNTLVSRQELIRYFQTQLAATNALPSLGTFSYTLNAPSFSVSGTANAAARYYFDYDAAGPKPPEPLRRFPLNTRLALLTSGTDAAGIRSAFGLTRDAASVFPKYRLWTYTGTAASAPAAITIKTVDQALAENREPNLFEILKTAIINGSLAVTAGNAARNSSAWETIVDNQVIRIGANIIDQYDQDNYPTTIAFNAVTTGSRFTGIEDLPYFSEMFTQLRCPEGHDMNPNGALLTYHSGSTVHLVTDFYFELWNPHQTPIESVPGPTTLRIRNGAGRYAAGLALVDWGTNPPPSVYISTGTLQWPRTATDVIDVNFSGSTNYRDPTITRDGATNLHDLGGGFQVNSFRVTGTFTLPANSSLAEDQVAQIFSSNKYENTVFLLEYEVSPGLWKPYTTSSGLQGPAGMGGINNGGGWLSAVSGTTYLPRSSWVKPDPRTDRLGIGYCYGFNDNPGDTIRYSGNFVNKPMTSAAVAYPGQVLAEGMANAAVFPGNQYPATLAVNTGANGAMDPDGKVRPGDAGLSSTLANPMTVPAARPVLLNRPFRSVGELGYVFRDQPWKSLDFFSGSSGDAALLDAFCLEESPVGESPIIAGQTSLNTLNKDVLRALISGAYSTPTSTSAKLAANLDTTAAAFAAFSGTNPAFSPAGLVTSLMASTTNSVTGANNSTESPIKVRREAIVRALASATQTRTWNLMIDLIAQSGKFPPNSNTLGNFVVQSERRYWLHVAIDRFTGEVIARQVETVQE